MRIPTVRFVEVVKKMNPDVIGISGLVTVTISKKRETVVMLKKAGISSNIFCSSGFKK